MKVNLSFVLSIAGLLLISFSAKGQVDKSTRPSPPVQISDSLLDARVTISYSAPSVKGRTIWGDLVPYGKVWRTGANEATTFETDKDIILQGQKLPAGKYALFTIPGKEEWTWIFNTVWDQWGAFKYDATKDVLRITSTPQASPVFNEQLRFEITGDHIQLHWENLSVGI
ncbi:MAG: DUF2911 domain-containing protein [Saprospiraceae bacterium]|nr:DUF2911 domain-containing protein [Candidatus Opimibacter iunctus]